MAEREGLDLRRYRVVVIPGDGIGPEIVEAAVEVLRAAEANDGNFVLDLEYHEGGRLRASAITCACCSLSSVWGRGTDDGPGYSAALSPS